MLNIPEKDIHGNVVGPDPTMEIKTLQGVQRRTGIGRGRGRGTSCCNNFIGWTALSPKCYRNINTVLVFSVRLFLYIV